MKPYDKALHYITLHCSKHWYKLLWSSLTCNIFFGRLQPQSQKVSTALLTMGIDPSTLQIDSSLLDTTFHLPQYPDSSVCTDYATKCQVFLDLANVTALLPKCNGKIPGTDIKTFPSVPQIVNYVVLPLVYKNVSKPVTYSPIYLFSTPNTFSSANDANYVTRCPTGNERYYCAVQCGTIRLTAMRYLLLLRLDTWMTYDKPFPLLLSISSAS